MNHNIHYWTVSVFPNLGSVIAFSLCKLAEELSQSENTKSSKWLIICCKHDMVCHLLHAILFFLSLVLLFMIVDDSFFGVVLHDSRK